MESDAELPRFELDGERFVRPDFAGRGLANVAPTVLHLLAPKGDGVALPPLAPSVLPESLSRGVTNVILLVADGLGHLQLEREIAAGNAPNLARLIERARNDEADVAYSPITSVFPTTTVAALGSVNSGVAPTDHGLLGYTIFLPEFNTIAEMIRWGPLNRRGSFADAEFRQSPEEFFWAQTMYARLHASGVTRTYAVNPIGFSGTALTRMLHQHATYAGYLATSSLGPMVLRLVNEGSPDELTYIYAYWPTIDTIAHLVGPFSAEHSSEVAAFDFQLGRLLAGLPRNGRTLVMITADHGHVDSVPEEAVQFDEHPELLAMLRVPPAGERRAVYLHPVAGATLDVAEYARERMHDVAVPMLRDDAVEMGLFGPGQLSERAAGRIGEVILFPRGTLQLVARIETIDGSVPRAPIFRGLHGGLTAEEALVPLLALRV